MAEDASYGLLVKKVSDFSALGITYENHAYTVTNAFEENGEKYIVVRNRMQINLIMLWEKERRIMR